MASVQTPVPASTMEDLMKTMPKVYTEVLGKVCGEGAWTKRVPIGPNRRPWTPRHLWHQGRFANINCARPSYDRPMRSHLTMTSSTCCSSSASMT